MSETTTMPEYVFWYKDADLKKENATKKSAEKFAKTADFREKQVPKLSNKSFETFLESEDFQEALKVHARPATKAEIADRSKFEPIRDAIDSVRKAEKAFQTERNSQRSAIRDWAIENCHDAEDFAKLVKDVPTYTYTIYNLIFCDHTLNKKSEFSKSQIKAWLEEVNIRRSNLTKKLVPLPEKEFIAAFAYEPTEKSQDATTAMTELIKAYAKQIDEQKADSK